MNLPTSLEQYNKFLQDPSSAPKEIQEAFARVKKDPARLASLEARIMADTLVQIATNGTVRRTKDL